MTAAGGGGGGGGGGTGGGGANPFLLLHVMVKNYDTITKKTRASRSTCTPRKHYCEMTDNTNIAHVASCTCS